MPEPTYVARGEKLIEMFAERNIAAALFSDPASPAQGVNVFADPADRYPRHSVWIDGDGYTWGRSYEFTLPESATLTEVVDAVVDSFERGLNA